ncbi:MAG: hypothetical protein DRO36_07345 [Candidatus Hecatellales archaeon]|nr:MAG: hypothetical protein DRO36_07345 [Candidatus Hecatellales archaeon]
MAEVGKVWLSVFRGTKARLNRVILKVLAQHGPLTISELRRKIRMMKDYHHTRYSVIYRRVQALEREDFIDIVGFSGIERKTPIYGLTPRGHLAILLDQINFDNILRSANKNKIISILRVLS